MKRIGILSSHNGSGFDTLLEACENKTINAQVILVISNNQEAKVLQKASLSHVPNFVVNAKKYPDENLDEKITKLMLEFKVDYIFLSGYMKKIEENLLKSFPNKIINSHPALLPKFGGKGMYGRFVHEAVIKEKQKESGCTIHFVNENYDEGKYIIQEKISLSSDESVETLEDKIKTLEKKAIVKAFKKILS
ncbi:phosphoribosylglycinamide formyltransferase [Arcobacter sp. KX21116]|jgi:phosphoribosylglycinamide formyltransferase-1|uniref:phosphoribosylglycinamide formyltransferase n=1 Tax=Arcobacter iocasae TaxID=2906515 RepID=UPI0035D4001D